MLRKLLYLTATVFSVAVCSANTFSAEQSFSLTTADRLLEPGWWPTKGDLPRAAYVGSSACLQCHGDIAALQQTTAMYHAAAKVDQSAILAKHVPLSFHEGSFAYSLVRAGSGTSLTASDGTSSAAELVQWAFGAGDIGQTYLLEQGGRFTEGRLSYYTSLGGLDITTGQAVDVPLDLDHALGNRLTTQTSMHCFTCHTTTSVLEGKFEPAAAVPGLGCEACHGPGAKHLTAMVAGKSDQASTTITNSGSMSPSDSVDFCGSCHRTSSDVSMLMPANLGLTSLRFQPYRLEKSRCWGTAGDARVTCIACHDPHRPLVRNLKAYDSKCLACHLVASEPPHGRVNAAACKVSTTDCASCHMPKYEVPQTHASFTDHDIRVVRKGEHFPS